jgi:Ca-activated chloride channel family protein
MAEASMNELWPHWLRLGWLLLLPLLIWLGWQLWHRPQRSGRWQALLPKAFHDALLSGGVQRSTRLPWLALTLGWLLALLALLGPSWQQIENNPVKRADPLVVVLDQSAEMLATDTPPSRQEQARRKVLDLLQARDDAQTAIVVYAGSAHSLVPLSDDLLTSSNLLESLKPSIMPVPGRRADLGVEKALQLLQQGANGKGRILLITAQLDSNEQAAIRRLLANTDTTVDILGVGTSEGAPITQADGSFVKDAKGSILLPRLDENSLRNLASNSGGNYSRMRVDSLDLQRLQLLDQVIGTRQSDEPTRLELWADAGHWLLLPLLLLAACASRRGWLFCLLPLLLAVPRPVYAFEFMDLWLTPDQQGARLLQQEQPAAAAEHFANPQWQGIAEYQAGNYADAASAFNHGDRAVDHFNRGNALAKNGDLEAALDAYETALERQPEMPQAQQNKTLIEQALRQQQEQQQPSDGQQGKEDQQQSGNDGQQQNPQQGKPQQGKQPEAGNPGETSASADQTNKSDAANQPGKPEAQQPADAAANQTQTDKEQGDKSTESASQTSNNAANEPLTGSSAKPGDKSGSASGQTQTSDEQGEETPARGAESVEELDPESRQALEQWLRQIPDDPSELLRRKFWYEQQRRQENLP